MISRPPPSRLSFRGDHPGRVAPAPGKPPVLTVAVLVSGTGSNLRALLEAANGTGFPARIIVVGADRQAEGSAHADEFGIPTSRCRGRASIRVRRGATSCCANSMWDPRPDRAQRADAPAAAGCRRRVRPAHRQRASGLPTQFPGAHGVRDALAAGAEQTGASVIVVDDGVDTGPILAQKRYPCCRPTTSGLRERVKPVERRLLSMSSAASEPVSSISPSHPPPDFTPSVTRTTVPARSSPMAGPSHDKSLYRDRDVIPVRRALVSVSDKTDLLVLAAALADAGVEFVSTGSTAATIRDAGYAVTDVAAVAASPSHSTGG